MPLPYLKISDANNLFASLSFTCLTHPSIMYSFIKKIIFLSALMALAYHPAGAQQGQSKEELQKAQKQLQKEIDDLNATYENIKKSKKQSLSQLAIVQRKIAKREQLVNNINKEVRNIDEDIYGKELEENHLKKELDTLRQKYAQSIVFAYKNRGSYEYLNFLFSATDFNDAMKRMMYLKSYRQYRETQAQTIAKTEDLLQQTIGTLNNSKVEKNKVLKVQSSQLQVLEQDKKEKDQVIKGLKDQEKDVVAQLKKRERQRQDLSRAVSAAIRREQEEIQRKEKERIAKLNAANKAAEAAENKVTNATKPAVANKPKLNNEPVTGVASAGSGTRPYSTFETTPEGKEMSINFENNRRHLPWPVSGGYVSHEFGVHEIPGTKLHEQNDGIFIATSIGSPVKCVADGEVQSVMDMGESQAVLVQHGKYFTTYSNLSSTNVSKGQKVSGGTVLGKAAANLEGAGEVGFMVMNDKNKFLDPQDWLKSR
jgi:septal ring factor EnvC (AmiA/AmiB activator)